jgi:hypothetical protein
MIFSFDYILKWNDDRVGIFGLFIALLFGLLAGFLIYSINTRYHKDIKVSYVGKTSSKVIYDNPLGSIIESNSIEDLSLDTNNVCITEYNVYFRNTKIDNYHNYNLKECSPKQSTKDSIK